MELKFHCTMCNEEYTEPITICRRCSSIVIYKPKLPTSFKVYENVKSIWRYEEFLPKLPVRITLNEGCTPLVKSKTAVNMFSHVKVYLKDETRNPTGSFRDRAASLIVSHAVSVNVSQLICASDGNHGASIAAYASRANVKCHVIVPSNVDEGKLAQMIAYGAKVEEYGTLLDDALDKAISIAFKRGYYQASAELNTLSIEGLKTIAYEIYEFLGNKPDWIIIPTGSGLTFYSIYKGFTELLELNVIDSIPCFAIVQSSGCPPIVAKLKGTKYIETKKKNIIKGLNVREPIFLNEILRLSTKVRIEGVLVDYSEAVSTILTLARNEGLFVEPAASAAFVGYIKLVKEGIIDRDDTVIILLTGSGLKSIDVFECAPRRKQLTILKGLDTKALILKLLKIEGPLHGYAIWKKLGLKVTVQAIYQHLAELESKGFIKGIQEDNRRKYKLTEKGYKLLEMIE